MSTLALSPSTTVRTPLRRPQAGLQARPRTRVGARPATRGQVRLTRRGRMVLLVGGLLVSVGAGFAWGSDSAATPRPEPTRVITVGTGDTLWQIADEVAPDGDVRSMVAHIEQLNGLDTAALQAGQKLVVPAGG